MEELFPVLSFFFLHLVSHFRPQESMNQIAQQQVVVASLLYDCSYIGLFLGFGLKYSELG